MTKTQSTAANRRKKSWREKLADSKGLPKTAAIDCTKTRRWGTGTFVIPAPIEVDAAMREIRRGKLTTIDRFEPRWHESMAPRLRAHSRPGYSPGLQPTQRPRPKTQAFVG